MMWALVIMVTVLVSNRGDCGGSDVGDMMLGREGDDNNDTMWALMMVMFVAMVLVMVVIVMIVLFVTMMLVYDDVLYGNKTDVWRW